MKRNFKGNNTKISQGTGTLPRFFLYTIYVGYFVLLLMMDLEVVMGSTLLFTIC